MTSQNIKAYLVEDRGVWTVKARFPDSPIDKPRIHTKSTGLRIKDNTKRKAEKKMLDIVADWERQYKTGRVSQYNPLFKDCVQEWLEAKAMELSPNTLAAYTVNAEKYIIPYLGHIHICDITRQDIQSYFKKLDGVISANSMKKHKVIINGTFEEALNNGIISAEFFCNVTVKIKLPKVQKYEGKALSDSELSLLLGHIQSLDEPMKSVLLIAVTYGLRRSEICGLRWEDIDFESGIMRIRNTLTSYSGMKYEAEKTKTKKSRRDLPLVDFTVPYLKELKASQTASGIFSGKVCVHLNGDPVNPEYVSKKAKQILSSMGLEDIRLHNLRHTVATFIVRHGSVKHAQAYLGHENIQTTLDIYSHISASDEQQVAQSINEFYKNAVFCSVNCSVSSDSEAASPAAAY